MNEKWGRERIERYKNNKCVRERIERERIGEERK